jgi:hypothetical protein
MYMVDGPEQAERPTWNGCYKGLNRKNGNWSSFQLIAAWV